MLEAAKDAFMLSVLVIWIFRICCRYWSCESLGSVIITRTEFLVIKYALNVEGIKETGYKKLGTRYDNRLQNT